jgi:hypothetical protein
LPSERSIQNAKILMRKGMCKDSKTCCLGCGIVP